MKSSRRTRFSILVATGFQKPRNCSRQNESRDFPVQAPGGSVSSLPLFDDIFVVFRRRILDYYGRAAFNATKIGYFARLDFDDVIFYVFLPINDEFSAYYRGKFSGNLMVMRSLVRSCFVMLDCHLYRLAGYDGRLEIANVPSFCILVELMDFHIRWFRQRGSPRTC